MLWSSSNGVMVSKVDQRIFTSKYKSHSMPHSFGLVPLRKLRIMVSKLD